MKCLSVRRAPLQLILPFVTLTGKLSPIAEIARQKRRRATAVARFPLPRDVTRRGRSTLLKTSTLKNVSDRNRLTGSRSDPWRTRFARLPRRLEYVARTFELSFALNRTTATLRLMRTDARVRGAVWSNRGPLRTLPLRLTVGRPPCVLITTGPFTGPYARAAFFAFPTESTWSVTLCPFSRTVTGLERSISSSETSRAWQPHAWMVRFHRRSVAKNPRC
jgi:hypothetical protein